MYEGLKGVGKVIIKSSGNGHYQIKGVVLINHWPNSKGRSCYMAGTTGSIKNVSCQQAINFALNPESMKVPNKSRRKSSYKNQRATLWAKSQYCGICGDWIEFYSESTLDHKIPISKGGMNHHNNYQLAHETCNKEKADKII